MHTEGERMSCEGALLLIKIVNDNNWGKESLVTLMKNESYKMNRAVNNIAKSRSLNLLESNYICLSFGFFWGGEGITM